MTNVHPISPEQEDFEQNAIWVMIGAMKAVQEQGYSDWQTLTSFVANLLLDQDNPMNMLKVLRDDVKLKMDFIRKERKANAN